MRSSRLITASLLVALTSGVSAAAPVAALGAERPTRLVAASKAKAPAGKKGKKSKQKGKTGGAPPADAAAPTPTTSSPQEPAAPPPSVALPPPPPLRRDRTLVGLLPIDGLDVSSDSLQTVEGMLFTEIEEIEGFTAVPSGDVASDAAAVGLTLGGCDDELGCVARLGRYARVHLVLAARVAEIGDALAVSLRIIDTQKGSESGRAAEVLPAGAEQRSQKMRHMLLGLLTPERYVGAINVSSPVPGAEVIIDDQPRGTTPLAKPVEKLPAGPHILRVAKSGYSDLYQFVDVVYGRETKVTVDLANNTVAGVLVEQPFAAGSGVIRVASNEPGIEVRIDGDLHGSTPLAEPTIKVSAGEHRLSLRRGKAPPEIVQLEVPPDKRVEVAVTASEAGIKIARLTTTELAAPLVTYEELVAVEIGPTSASAPLGVASPPPARQRRWRLPGALASGGLAVLSYGAWGWFGAETRVKTDAANEAIGRLKSGELSASAYEALRSRLDREGSAAERNAWIALGGAALFSLVGGGLFGWELYEVGTSLGHGDVNAAP